MSLTVCPCGSGQQLPICCGRYHAGLPAPSAEALMRSRYSAYVLGLIDYLVATTVPIQQAQLDRQAMFDWSHTSTWLSLAMESHETMPSSAAHANVSFTVYWQDGDGEHKQHEKSAFVQSQGRWYFIDPSTPLRAGRNEQCPCSSGRKFKKCCAVFI